MRPGVGRRARAVGLIRAGVLSLLLLAACASPRELHQAARSEPRAPVGTAAEVPIVPPTGDFTGAPPATSGPGPSFVRAATGDGKGLWAVVIGISDYAGSSHDLLYARNDADDMVAVLSRAGQPAAQRAVLNDGHATAATIRSALDWLTANAGPDSTSVVFFAGHVRKLAPTTEALLAADGQTIPDREVAAHLSTLRSAHTWIVIAGCFGGGFTEVLGPGRILTAAAPANSLAYETGTFHRSYLGEYLVNRGMLQGLGGSTVQSAFAYASQALRREHPDRMPVEFDDAGGPLSLSGPLAANARAARAAPATTTTTSPPRPAPGPTTTTTTSPASAGQRCLVTAGSLVRCSGDP